MEHIEEHARHTYQEIEAEGIASRPLDWPPPNVKRGVRVNALVVHPETGQRDILPGVIHREEYTKPRPTVTSPSSSSPTNATVAVALAASASTDTSNATKNNRSESNDGRVESSNSHHSQQQKREGGVRRDAIRQREGERSSTSQPSRESVLPQSNEKRQIATPRPRPKSNDIEFIAYFPQRRLQDAIYGSVWACLVLRRHYGPAADDAARAANLSPGDSNAPIVWEIVGTHVAIKMVEWARVHQARGRLLEDPVKEVAAMQMIGAFHPNVLGSLEVLQDDEFLFSIMPFASGGDLFGYVVRDTELRGGDGGMAEPAARYWFQQILQGLHFLQSKGICHRDLSLENILVDEDNCLIIDFGMCVRVPYSYKPLSPSSSKSRSNGSSNSSQQKNKITDVTRGGIRRLIKPYGTCGKHNYMSPEIFQNSESFDGFAIDLWAAGVILYIMLTGFPPYDHATLADQRFEIIVGGQLVEQLKMWDIELSEEAGKLLQSMLQLKAKDRLTLAQVMEHPWVTNPEITSPPKNDNFLA